jgi:hypothetical protein
MPDWMNVDELPPTVTEKRFPAEQMTISVPLLVIWTGLESSVTVPMRLETPAVVTE